MTSFKFGGLSEKDQATGRFMGRFNRALATAAVRQKKVCGITQRSVSEAMGVDKSVVSRILAGGGNPTLRTIGELAWAMGLRPTIIFEPIDTLAHNAAGEPIKIKGVPSLPRPTEAKQAVTNTASVEWHRQVSMADA